MALLSIVIGFNKFQINEEEISSNEYLKLRIQHVQKEKEEGKTVYPHKFHVSISLVDFIKKYETLAQEEASDEVLTVAGRIHAIRESSQKLRFYDLRGEGVKLQVRGIYVVLYSCFQFCGFCFTLVLCCVVNIIKYWR